MSTTVPGLEAIRAKLETIHADCSGDDGKGKQGAESKDEFVKFKEKLYAMLTLVREKIKYRHGVMKKHGNNVEAIQLGIKIKSMLDEMDKVLPKLQEVLRKQSESLFSMRRISTEETEERYKDLRTLKRHIDEAKKAFNSHREIPDDDEFADAWAPSTEQGRRNELRIPDGQVDTTGRDATAEETELTERWRQRDAQFDSILDEISLEVDALGQHAVNIGEAAERQNIMIQEMNLQGDKAREDMKSLSSRIQQVMKEDNNSTFVCRLIMLIILLALVGYLVSSLKKS